MDYIAEQRLPQGRRNSIRPQQTGWGGIDIGAKPDYGNFAFELRKKDPKHFPALFKFDDNFKLSGLTILR